MLDQAEYDHLFVYLLDDGNQLRRAEVQMALALCETIRTADDAGALWRAAWSVIAPSADRYDLRDWARLGQLIEQWDLAKPAELTLMLNGARILLRRALDRQAQSKAVALPGLRLLCVETIDGRITLETDPKSQETTRILPAALARAELLLDALAAAARRRRLREETAEQRAVAAGEKG